MKTKYNFEIVELDDGKVAIPVGKDAEKFSAVIKVNDTAVDILKSMEQDTTEEKLVEALLEKYTGDRVQIAEYVHEFIEKLNTEGLVQQ